MVGPGQTPASTNVTPNEAAEFSWEDLRLFSSVAAIQSFVQAASSLGSTPHDVRKRIDQLEAKLGVAVIGGGVDRIVLTPAGAALRSHIELMSRAAGRVAHAASADAQELPPRFTVLANLEAEQALLGAILFDNDVYRRITPKLRADHFYDPAHGLVFETCAALLSSGLLADGVTVRERLARDGGLAAVGGASYLLTLLESAAKLSAHAIEYADLIWELAERRELVRLASDPSSDLVAIADAAKRLIKSVGQLAPALVALDEGKVDAAILRIGARKRTGSNLTDVLASPESDSELVGPFLSASDIEHLRKELSDGQS